MAPHYKCEKYSFT